MTMFDDFGVYHVCPICGKTFYVPDATAWVYKKHIRLDGWDRHRFKLLCSWSCYRKYEKEHPRSKVDYTAY